MPAWQTGTQTKHRKQAGAQSNVYQCVHDARMSQRTSVCPHHILTALTHCLGAALPFQAAGTAAPCPRTQQPDAALHLLVGQHHRHGICR